VGCGVALLGSYDVLDTVDVSAKLIRLLWEIKGDKDKMMELIRKLKRQTMGKMKLGELLRSTA
jgi:hypothetical protein